MRNIEKWKTQQIPTGWEHEKYNLQKRQKWFPFTIKIDKFYLPLWNRCYRRSPPGLSNWSGRGAVYGVSGPQSRVLLPPWRGDIGEVTEMWEVGGGWSIGRPCCDGGGIREQPWKLEYRVEFYKSPLPRWPITSFTHQTWEFHVLLEKTWNLRRTEASW